MSANRGRVVWIIAVLGLLMLAPSAASAASGPCNGSPDLCDKTLDEVVLPGTHNSMSAAENTWALPNQSYSISHQLNLGIRAMLIDTHYARVNENGTVTDISKSAGRDQMPPTPTWLCHEFCQLGKVDLIEELGRIARFLANNPREVLVFINQDGISPEDYETAVTDSGLLPYVYQGSVDTFPTLEQMIDSGQRVVMLAEQESAGVPWYHNAYDGSVMETDYAYPSTEARPGGGLDDPALLDETCAPNRGNEPSPLFLMNHWVTTGVTPDIEKAKVVNTRPVLVARARACEARRGKLPNILAVDFFGTGDVTGAARELNGIPDPIVPPGPQPAKPLLEITKPKARTVKATRKAMFRIPIENAGFGAATAVKVCAIVPKRLARKSRCVKIASIPAGGSAVAKIRIATKKRYRKASGRIQFMVFSSQSDQPTLSKSTRLTVKPLKKAKRHKKR